MFCIAGGMFRPGITSYCAIIASVLAIAYILTATSNTENIIMLKITEDAGPTAIPFPENLRGGLKVCSCRCYVFYWQRYICKPEGEVDGEFVRASWLNFIVVLITCCCALAPHVFPSLQYAQVYSLFPNIGGNLSYSNTMGAWFFDPGTTYQWLAKGEIDTAIFNVVITEGTLDPSVNNDENVDGTQDVVITVKIEVEGINSPPVNVDNNGMASCTPSVMVGERGSCSASFYDVDHSDFTPGSGYFSQLELRGIPLERCVTFARQFPGEDIITVYCNFKTDNCRDIGLLEGLGVTLEDGKGGKAFAPANTVCIRLT